MRASSGRLLVLCLALLLTDATVSAHRLDEYLHAARIDLQPDQVSIELDLTPGTEIAESIIGLIDRDRDGVASLDEQNGYVADVVRQLRIALDGTTLPLRVISSTFPGLDALRAGEGAIRLHLTARHPALWSGRHELTFKNSHLPGQSVYLANALVPKSTGVSVTAQRRTVDQRELTIEYFVRPGPDATIDSRLASMGSSGALVGLMAAVLIVRYARRQGARL